MSAFSRHSSARNTGKERRTRKASVSAGSIAGGKKQNSTETMRRETEEQTEMGCECGFGINKNKKKKIDANKIGGNDH
jgi:hypothetical protein